MSSTDSRSIRTKFIAVADSLAGLHDESMGDEREALVITKAYTFALVLGTAALMVCGAVFALFGYWVFALGAVLFGGLQSYLAVAYASAHGVSLFELTERTSPARKRKTAIVFGVVACVMFGARIFQMLSGSPVFGDYGSTEPASDALSESIGLVVGAVCGVVAVLVFGVIQKKRRQARDLQDDE